MHNPNWKGVFPAVTTQMHRDQSLDLEATARHIEALIDAGVQGLVMLGSLGETVARISDVTGTAAMAMGEIAAANLQTVGQADTGAASAQELDRRINALQAEAAAFVRRLRAA